MLKTKIECETKREMLFPVVKQTIKKGTEGYFLNVKYHEILPRIKN